MLNKYSVKSKLWAILFLSVVGAVMVVLYEVSHFRQQLHLGREAELVHLIENTVSLIESIHEREAEIGREEAQQQALALIKALRYDDGKGYYWINDYQANVIMHPIKPQLDGKDLSDLADSNGVKLFSEFAKVAKNEGAGYVRYLWEVPGSDEPEPKSSYVAAFKPWGWVIGTGVYMHDLDNMYWAEVTASLIMLAVVFSIVGCVIVMIARSITVPIDELVSAMKTFATGDLRVSLHMANRADEIGELQQSLLQMQNAYREMISNSQKDMELLSSTAQELSEVSSTTDGYIAQQFMEADSLAAAVEELAAAAGEVGQNATETASLTSSTNDNVATSSALMSETIQTVNALASDIEQATQTVNQLQQDVGQIDGILDVIRNISEQTNLLALNAAIEAARAGESGRGFAVVADEVRTLAQRTHESTEEIQSMTEALQAQSNKAVEMMNVGVENTDRCLQMAEKTGDNLAEVARQVNEVSDRNTTVASAVEEQSAVASEISRNVTSIRDSSELTREQSQKLSSNGQELQALSAKTSALLSQYKV